MALLHVPDGNRPQGYLQPATLERNRRDAENGVVVFTSSTGKQYSLEDKAWNNGAFTKALVEGIDGKADLLKSGKITVDSLSFYVSERVKVLTNGKQTPTGSKPNTIVDFPIGIK